MISSNEYDMNMNMDVIVLRNTNVVGVNSIQQFVDNKCLTLSEHHPLFSFALNTLHQHVCDEHHCSL